ncbi:hypothetical protein BDV93DRAFT_524936 [Ceratobasidium sp. AG-I]|nr:hypothetical protein BDV93DRAFT_524936 [Ceratobasidium sp. AG-I]
MVSGAPYLASDPYIRQVAKAQRAKLKAINKEEHDDERMKLLRAFINTDKDAQFDIWAPFFCEYGFNIKLGNDVFMGTGCTVLDVCPGQ